MDGFCGPIQECRRVTVTGMKTIYRSDSQKNRHDRVEADHLGWYFGVAAITLDKTKNKNQFFHVSATSYFLYCTLTTAKLEFAAAKWDLATAIFFRGLF
jgi:hypothetical protein